MGGDKPPAAAGSEQHPWVQAPQTLFHQPAQRWHQQTAGSFTVRTAFPTVCLTASERWGKVQSTIHEPQQGFSFANIWVELKHHWGCFTKTPLMRSFCSVLHYLTQRYDQNLGWHLSFVCVCLLDIQILMGSLVYLRHGIENSPYRSLLETDQWAEICNIFTRDACALLGLSVESPLSVRSVKSSPKSPNISRICNIVPNQ